MKKYITILSIIIYVAVLLGFRMFSGTLRDRLSIPVEATNIFVYDSAHMSSLYTLPECCLYTESGTGNHFVYILDTDESYDDDGYYIMPYYITLRDRADGFISVGAIAEIRENLVVVTPVTEDMVGERAVIGKVIDYLEEISIE